MAQPIWNTPAGTLGTYPALIIASTQLSGSPVVPAISVTYTLISGNLPPGLSMTSSGLISGIPSIVSAETTSTFVIRLTDNLGNIRDRTFSMTVSGLATPTFTTPNGSLLSTNDSVWVQLQIEYDNPIPTNPVTISVFEGALPPGLEINEAGLIRGYPTPPTVNITVPAVTTTAISTSSVTDQITCLSTTGFDVNRPVLFSGTTFGYINPNVTYYIKDIINATTFTISTISGGATLALGSGSGSMTVTLPPTSVGEPTLKNYAFTLKINSPLGSDVGNYTMTVINQHTPISQGGPGLLPDTRVPTIYNTRPPTFDLSNSDPYYGYYVLPPNTDEYNDTYPITVPAFMGIAQSNNYFAFKIIGHDFDGTELNYTYNDLPLGLVGDATTGWITGNPTLSTTGINQYTFSAAAYKVSNPTITSPTILFAFDVANDLIGDIVWITPNDLGTILNGTVSIKSVRAVSDVELEYRITSGSLPPNLTLLSNGEIAGCVADQPTTDVLSKGDSTEFTFVIEAYSPIYPGIKSSKTFTLEVLQEYDQPTDTLYIKATPSIQDRVLLDTLLNNETIIPTNALYRAEDVYFGKATNVTYEHAYGIYSSDIGKYLDAVTRNHYWRNITLGEIKTAVAKDENGNTIYEVVYSQVIDDLVNPQGVSISSSIYWPRPIDLNLGPWYTSSLNIFTSYVNVFDQAYYTSLSPGTARTLYPNSLYNMRNRVANVLGQEYDSRILPLWMTSQQENGSTLGYTQAWVICYTKPGFSKIIKNNIETLWLSPEGTVNTLNRINFKIDRFSVDKSITYNYDENTDPTAWTGLPSGTPVPDPLDSKDFYVLFPRKTILPNK